MAATGSDFTLGAHPALPKGLPVCVAILDGYGENEFKDEYNAVHSAKTPVFDKLRAEASRFRTVAAHGPAVGLPSSDDMGNSEVGHNALGSGKIYAQGAKLVDINIANKQLFKDEGWGYIKAAFAANTVHFISLLSSGGVHSRYNQLIALVKEAAADGAKRIRLHIMTDGRDVPDNTGAEYIETLEKDLRELEAAHSGDYKIGSGGGRMQVTMDRYEADWPMVERGWKAHVLGEAPTKSTSAIEAYKTLKEGGISDQNIGPFVVVDGDGKPVGPVQDNDAVVIANFRSDRVIEISKAFECVSQPFIDFASTRRLRPRHCPSPPPPASPLTCLAWPLPPGPMPHTIAVADDDAPRECCRHLHSPLCRYADFSQFDRVRVPQNLKFVGLMQYDGDLKLPKNFLVPPPAITHTSGEYLAKNGLKSFACSETQKFGHVTFFWNGNRSGYFDETLETYVEIPSDNCVFNEKPLMKVRRPQREALESGSVA